MWLLKLAPPPKFEQGRKLLEAIVQLQLYILQMYEKWKDIERAKGIVDLL